MEVSCGPLPGSEKFYVKGEIFDIEVPMRRINLSPTIDLDGQKVENDRLSCTIPPDPIRTPPTRST